MIRGLIIFAAGVGVGLYLPTADGEPTTMVASACHVTYRHGLPGPDGDCTPGANAHLTRAQVCTHKDRPGLPAATRREILAEYGVGGWSGKDGELDHRVPFALGGRTTENNIWPEPGGIPNAKDKLEFAVYRRVCDDRDMTVKAAVRVFKRDWRRTYEQWKADGRL
jgi:hypothetical protein